MLTKIINTVLIAAIIPVLFLTAKKYFNLDELRVINEESKNYILSFLSKLPQKESKYLDKYISNSSYLANSNSFLELREKAIEKTEINILKAHQILKPLDAIIENDPLAEKWKENKSEIQKIFIEASHLNDSLKRNLEKQNVKELFQKNTISLEEWQKIILATTTFKSILNSMVGGYGLCFEYGYNFIGIPSKKVVQVNEIASVDWINYYGGHFFINETYQVESNYDEFHILETTYDPCGNDGTETILLEEYQIPFSEIEKNQKWRSVFYFRNDKLEQDSVVLERELEF